MRAPMHARGRACVCVCVCVRACMTAALSGTGRHAHALSTGGPMQACAHTYQVAEQAQGLHKKA